MQSSKKLFNNHFFSGYFLKVCRSFTSHIKMSKTDTKISNVPSESWWWSWFSWRPTSYKMLEVAEKRMLEGLYIFICFTQSLKIITLFL